MGTTIDSEDGYNYRQIRGNAFSLNPCRLWSHSHAANAITLALLATAIDVKKKRTDNLKSEASNQTLPILTHFKLTLPVVP